MVLTRKRATTLMRDVKSGRRFLVVACTLVILASAGSNTLSQGEAEKYIKDSEAQ
jgi:hypothetical protein